MANRRVIQQVLHNNATTLYLAGPVQQQQSLTSGMTYVAQFDIFQSPTIDIGDRIDIRAVDLDTGLYSYQFRGTINRIAAAHFPHTVTVYCSGPLSLLRRARKASDSDLTGFDDGAAVRSVLTYCGISYDPDDIQSAGMTLGLIQPVYFKKGQTGGDFIAALDDALGFMTIEVNQGRVVRFPYSLVPSDYDDAYATYSGDDSDVRIYANQRDRGNVDSIANIVEVTGVSFECGPEDECNCTLVGTADADNALLGPGVRTGPLTYSSEFLQGEYSVSLVTERLLRWNNRINDQLTIEAPNDTRVWPGRPVDVIDSEYGIDLTTETRYVVTDVARNGDFMTLTLTGGAAGAVDNFVFQDIMECNDEEDDGPPAEEDEFVAPIDIPPVTDFITCPDEEEEPNIEDRFILCTEEIDNATATAIVPVDEVGTVDWQFVSDTMWRTHNTLPENNSDEGIGAHFDGDGVMTEMLLWRDQNVRMSLNKDPGVNDDKDDANDVLYGPAPILTISGSFWFDYEGIQMTIFMRGNNGASVAFYIDPGSHIDGPGHAGDHYWAVRANGENRNGQTSDDLEPHDLCRHSVTNCNNGGVMGKDTPFPTGEWIDFTVEFDISNELNRIDVRAGDISGYLLEHDHWGDPSNFAFEIDPCEDPHQLTISIAGVPGTGYDRTNPWGKLRLNSVGHTTCELNPNYGGVPEMPGEADTVPCLPAEAPVDEAPEV